MSLTDYRMLGRSGLIVSPIALGTMTFDNRNFGTPEAESRAVFDAYCEAGGNFIDTANVYAGGRSEQLVGKFIAERALRDRVVLATKFGQNVDPTHPHGGGNGRKHVYNALKASLQRLQTDHVDLYWLHVFDTVTPAEELVQVMTDLVRAGHIRYYGLSNVPAWYAAKVAALAAAHGLPGPIGLQLEYSLVERNIEHEHVPAARDGGMGVISWSPLAGGFLSGKYASDRLAESDGRLVGKSNFPGRFTKFTERNWRILETLLAVAREIGRPAAQVALAWNVSRAGVTAALVGAKSAAQLDENIGALDIVLSDAQFAALDAASALPQTYPYSVLEWEKGRGPFHGASIRRWGH